MGVDFYRCTVKPDSELKLVESLIQQQAIAFQSMPGGQVLSQACSHANDVHLWLMEKLHGESYLAASNALLELLAIPDWDDERQCSSDVPGLSICMSVYPITGNPVLPPLWRMQAYRTYSPSQLPLQIAEWNEWTRQVTAGDHADYVRRLHMFHDSDFARYHWSYLREQACSDDGAVNDSAYEEIRHEILVLSEPIVWPAPIDPSARKKGERGAVNFDKDEEVYAKLLATINQLVQLTNAWNSCVEEKRKVPEYGYDGNYFSSLDHFKTSTISEGGLPGFLAWADQCVENECGLFLSY